LGFSILPDGVIDLKQQNPGLTLAPIMVFTVSMAARSAYESPRSPAGFDVLFLARQFLLDAVEVA